MILQLLGSGPMEALWKPRDFGRQGERRFCDLGSDVRTTGGLGDTVVMEHASKSDSARGTPVRPRTLLDRVRRAQRIAQLRAAGKTWTQVSDGVGPSAKAAQMAHNDYLAWDVETPDPMMTVDTSIAIRSAAIDRLDEIAHTGDNASAQVGALRLMLDADRERLEILQASGRVPRNLHRYRAEADFMTIFREMVDLMHRLSVPDSVLQEVRELAARHVQHPSRNGNGRHPDSRVSGGGPGERLRVVVVGGEVGLDRVDQVGNAVEDPAADRFVAQAREEDLDHVQP